MDNNTALVSMATLDLRLGIDRGLSALGRWCDGWHRRRPELIGFAAAASATLETEVGLNFVIG